MNNLMIVRRRRSDSSYLTYAASATDGCLVLGDTSMKLFQQFAVICFV